jgi:hypothetical protein
MTRVTKWIQQTVTVGLSHPAAFQAASVRGIPTPGFAHDARKGGPAQPWLSAFGLSGRRGRRLEGLPKRVALFRRQVYATEEFRPAWV